jgi:hypothetical protein
MQRVFFYDLTGVKSSCSHTRKCRILNDHPVQGAIMTKKIVTEIPANKKSASLEKLFQDKSREAKLSIQNNPDGLPWIKNKVIKESLVGKRKTH